MSKPSAAISAANLFSLLGLVWQACQSLPAGAPLRLEQEADGGVVAFEAEAGYHRRARGCGERGA